MSHVSFASASASASKKLSNSDSPSDEQKQFISKQSETCWFLLIDFNLFFLFLSPFSGSLSPHWKVMESISRTQISENLMGCVTNLISLNLLANFPSSVPLMDFKAGEAKAESEDADARGRIAVLEEQSNQHSHVIAMLQNKVTQLSTDLGRLVGEVSALRSVAVGISKSFGISFGSANTNWTAAE
jgi:hypothetical protein